MVFIIFLVYIYSCGQLFERTPLSGQFLKNRPCNGTQGINMTKKATTPTKSKTSKKNSPLESNQEDKLFAIRDLLFGEQVSQLEAAITNLNAEMEKRFNTLEKNLDKASSQFNAALDTAVADLNESLDKNHLEHVSQEAIIEDNLGSLSKAFNQFQEQTGDNLDNAEKALKEASKTIYRSLEKEVKSLNKKIEKASKELSSNKADRKTLASMLETMATNLNQPQA